MPPSSAVRRYDRAGIGPTTAVAGACSVSGKARRSTSPNGRSPRRREAPRASPTPAAPDRSACARAHERKRQQHGGFPSDAVAEAANHIGADRSHHETDTEGGERGQEAEASERLWKERAADADREEGIG